MRPVVAADKTSVSAAQGTRASLHMRGSGGELRTCLAFDNCPLPPIDSTNLRPTEHFLGKEKFPCSNPGVGSKFIYIVSLHLLPDFFSPEMP